MAYISAENLAGRLPLEGEGLAPEEIQEAIDAAVEDVSEQTGDTTGVSARLRQAVINLTMAELFDTKLYPQDARRPGTDSSSFRDSAARDIASYIKTHTDVDEDPLTSNAEFAYVEVAPF